MVRYILILFLALGVRDISAHQFHVALAKTVYNEKDKAMEVTLEAEAHDIEHWLEDKGIKAGHLEMIERNSDLWKKMSKEILANFGATTDKQKLVFYVVGIEVVRDGRVFIYVYAERVEPFNEITWTFSLLMDHDDSQQNKLEMKWKSKKYYAVFLHTKRTATIKIKDK
ncbi:hypothetical protein GCM10009118_12880 [Wandonia haliotis]|uniref:Uncharacterized protein n=1 Tax=Wandonia haliotis TaxID=574963 RepID=A0ABN1MP66_9FLAO